jgi:uncharacterized protein (TIGR00255 family)
MIKSMTGYGRAQAQLHGRDITVELRSVNNRYLDCSVKLPRIYGFAEDAVKSRIKKAVSRGKVDVFITVQAAEIAQVAVSVNRPVLEGYLTALHQIAADYGVTDDITVMSLSRLPDVLTVQKQEEDEDEVQADLMAVLDEALARYDAMRTVEGQALEDDLRSRAQTILDRVAVVEARSPETVAEYRARLTRKMEEVLSGTAVDESRILTEAAIYADKVAVDEETVRLRSHLAQLDDMLSGGGAIGRKLDFLLQEMNREANTIGSKCNDVELARTVVDIKAELEKIREQTQNIE